MREATVCSRVDLAWLKPRLGRLDPGLGRLDLRLGLLRHRLGVRERGLGLEHGDVDFRIVDQRQELALLDPVAAVDVQLLEIAGDLGVERGELERPDRPRHLRRPRHPPAMRLDDLNGDRGSGLVGLTAAASRCPSGLSCRPSPTGTSRVRPIPPTATMNAHAEQPAGPRIVAAYGLAGVPCRMRRLLDGLAGG